MSSSATSEEFAARLALIKAGDQAAFASLLRDCDEKLLRYVHRHFPLDLRSRIDIGDVLQEIYLEAFRRIGQFTAQDDDSIHRWLFTIARHQLIDLIRHHRALKRGAAANAMQWSGDHYTDEIVGMLQDLRVYERTPSQSAMSHEAVSRMQSAVANLRPIYQQVIDLRYLRSLSVNEVAQTLGRGPRAVHMLCNRALKQLRAELDRDQSSV